MTRLLPAVVIAIMYVLHQDLWFWRDARPLVFGFLPVGLAYHGAYCLAVAALMWWLTRIAWPSHLEPDAGPSAPPPDVPPFARVPAGSRRHAAREGGRS